MSDFVAEVLKRYGVVAILIALVAACAVWGLAHTVAAPGSEVSVLWGLVKYTKQPPTTVAVGTSTERLATEGLSRPSGAPTKGVEARSSFEPFVHAGVSRDGMEKTLNSIRSRRALREITAAESGRPALKIPSGTYFFLLSKWLHGASVYKDGKLVMAFAESVGGFSASRYRISDEYAEIHYPRGEEPQLVLYFDESTAYGLAKLSGADSKEVTGSILPWANATTLASIPFSRVVGCRLRQAQISKGDSRLVFDMLLQ